MLKTILMKAAACLYMLVQLSVAAVLGVAYFGLILSPFLAIGMILYDAMKPF